MSNCQFLFGLKAVKNLFFPSGVVVALEGSTFSVNEGVDSVMVCAAITSGELEDNVFANVQLTTMDGSAGEIVLISLTHETQSPECSSLLLQWLTLTTFLSLLLNCCPLSTVECVLISPY